MLTIHEFVILGIVAECERRCDCPLDLGETAERAVARLIDPIFDERVALVCIGQLRKQNLLEFDGYGLYITSDGRSEFNKYRQTLKALSDWAIFI